ncbi:MAG: phosphate ABC transporter permease PstA [Gemmatimonadetes bacterium]|nr:phosphate ABC transporter permease PstA [Gemmatimonadota bacterium]
MNGRATGAAAEVDGGRTTPSDEAAKPVEPLVNRGRGRVSGTLFRIAAVLATFVGIGALGVLLFDVIVDGAGRLDWGFITNFASRFPERAGIRAALAGSTWILVLTALFAFPLGVASSIYLEEYAPDNWVRRLIQTNITNLAGVPSIVYGVLGLALFVRFFALERSVLAGALTLALLVMPVIILSSQEAIRAVPGTIREAAYGLGATRWQVVSRQVLPMALPGILTGTILSLSRAVGETAPLIIVGGVGFIAFTPSGPLSSFTVLPIQIFGWISRPQEEFREIAAAGIIVLLALLLTINGAAIILRNRYQTQR